jgi:hypothetical protein
MKLHIESNNYLNDVQENFHQLFPHLKLEFQFNGQEGLHLSARLGKSFPHIRINELCHSCLKSFFDIEGKMTVKEVENLFRQCFGLPAHVYVREGKYWQKSPAFDSRKLMN